MPESAEDLLRRSNAARGDGRAEEASQLAERAADSATDTEDREHLGSAKAALARLARDDGQLDLAITLYQEAAHLARETGDALRLAHRLRHLGDIHQEMDHLPIARRYYEHALALYRSRPDTPVLDLANLLRPLATLEERMGAEARSAELWAEAGTLYAEAKVQAGVAESARRLERLITR